MENWQKLSQNYFQILILSGATIRIILTSALSKTTCLSSLPEQSSFLGEEQNCSPGDGKKMVNDIGLSY